MQTEGDKYKNVKPISRENSTSSSSSFKSIISPWDDSARDINDEEMDLGWETASIVVVPSSIFSSGKVLHQVQPLIPMGKSVKNYSDLIKRQD